MKEQNERKKRKEKNRT